MPHSTRARKEDNAKIDKELLGEVIDLYKKDFYPAVWKGHEEGFKWTAVQHFQNSWDVGADDFPAMLEDALSECGSLYHDPGVYCT